MADNNELQETRIDGTVDNGINLAAKWPNFEAAVRTIFGIPADTVLAEAFSIDSVSFETTMTGNLTLSGAPTADLHAATKAYLVSQASTMGGIRARAYLTGDQVLPGLSSYIEFDAANINEGGVWEAPNPSRLTIPVGGDGHYMVGASVSYAFDSGDSKGWTYLNVNRASSYELIYEEQNITGEIAVSGLHVIPNLVAGDYIELRLYPRTFGDSTLYAANTTLWLFNLT